MGGGGCWSWSLFFCGALPSDHLHQVDIRRVYSGVCNCILSPVLHCQPWKWNLINPDQFLMYKMNWQGFKKKRGELQFKSGEWYTAIFFSVDDWAAPPPATSHHLINPPAFNYHITPDLFFFQSKGEHGRGQLKVKIHVCMNVCVCIHACVYVCGYTYRCWFCMCACFSCVWGGDDAWRKCVREMAQGVKLPHIQYMGTSEVSELIGLMT